MERRLAGRRPGVLDVVCKWECMVVWKSIGNKFVKVMIFVREIAYFIDLGGFVKFCISLSVAPLFYRRSRGV